MPKNYLWYKITPIIRPLFLKYWGVLYRRFHCICIVVCVCVCVCVCEYSTFFLSQEPLEANFRPFLISLRQTMFSLGGCQTTSKIHVC